MSDVVRCVVDVLMYIMRLSCVMIVVVLVKLLSFEFKCSNGSLFGGWCVLFLFCFFCRFMKFMFGMFYSGVSNVSDGSEWCVLL